MSIFSESNYRYYCIAFQISYYYSLLLMSETKDIITFLNEKKIISQINIPMPQLKFRIEIQLKRILTPLQNIRL